MNDKDNKYQDLISLCREVIECDTARIISASGTLFLVIGFNRNTKDNNNTYWTKNNRRYNFDYVEEQTIASGKTQDEVLQSAKEYDRLSNITMKEYINELISNKDTK